ncbi:putative BRI1 kinase inhibitor 1 [Acorus gramineus]|uniref:BRI1 kinase inhibitor 1 n=1 Tax=Acorus gramineus TaxID=55184 RepID=A0AAV9AHY5_ACOGR|nr:putative BRI1 kinase inhibitor 1 [Acorus gramineus]
MATQKDSKMVVVGGEEKKEHKTKGHPSPPPPSPPPPQRNLIASTTSPPTSSSSSPSHEFSFTISLHPSIDDPNQYNNTTKSPPPFTAIDLAPADDIFFHGHLLPLRILSHQVLIPPTTNTSSSSSSTVSFDPPIEEPKPPPTTTTNDTKPKKPNKPIRNLSNLFGAEFSRVVKKYVSASLLFLRGSSTREKAEAVRRRPCTFSGKDSDLVLKERRERWKGRRGGQFSAPASMRTSPTNSGLLMATAGGATFSSSDESTMEELNNAIQAAVAHCKNSIAMKEEKCKC